MTDLFHNAVAAAKIAGHTCIAQNAVELIEQHGRLILPAPATAHSWMPNRVPGETITYFIFEDGSELCVGGFSGNRIDAYWSNETQSLAVETTPAA